MSKNKNKSNQGKRWTLALGIGVLGLGLVGCGDGNNGAAGVGGSAAGAANSQIDFRVDNTSGYEIQSVQIMNDSGQELAKGDMNCAKGATCNFKGVMSVPGSLKFYDKSHTLVGAYLLPKAPEADQYVKLTGTMLGLYVFKELRSRYPEPVEAPELLLGKVNHLFAKYESADGRPDKLEELGQYYRYRMVGTGLSSEDFYKDLHRKLKTGESLPANLFKTDQLAATAGRLRSGARTAALSVGADAEGCPQGISNILDVLESSAGSVPFIGGLFEAGKLACDSSRPETALNDINNQLTTIESKLDTMGLSLEKLKAFTEMQAVTKVLNDTNVEIGKLSPAADYLSLVKEHGSFRAFIDDAKGVEKAWDKQPIKMKNILGSLASDWKALTGMDGVKDGSGHGGVGDPVKKGNLAIALGEYCNGSESATINWVARRNQCNAAIAYYQSQIVPTYMKRLVMLRDISSTLQAYWAKEKTFIDKNVTMPVPEAGWDWADEYQKALLPGLEKGLALAKGDFAPANLSYPKSSNTYFRPWAGVPEALLTRLADPRLKCSTGTAPNIQSFIRNGSDSYITIACRDTGAKSGGDVVSRYYFEKGTGRCSADGGLNPSNIMGVLVPSYYCREREEIDGHSYATNNLWVRLRPIAPRDEGSITFATKALSNGYSAGSIVIGSDETSSRFRLQDDGKVIYASGGGGMWYGIVYIRATDKSGQSSVAAISVSFGMGGDHGSYAMTCLGMESPACVSSANSVEFDNGALGIYAEGVKSGDTFNIVLRAINN